MNIEQTVSVLIMTDNTLTSAGLRTVLTDEKSIQVLGESENIADTIQKCHQSKPTVVFVHCRLAKQDVIDSVTQIHEQFQECRFLLMDVWCSMSEVVSLIDHGVYGYCFSNTTIPKLKAAIQSVSDSVLWVPPDVLVHRHNTQICQRHSNDMSEREKEVLRHVAGGLSNHEIANALCLSTETVKTHVRHIMNKLVVSDRTQAAVKAIQMGLVKTENPEYGMRAN